MTDRVSEEEKKYDVINVQPLSDELKLDGACLGIEF